MKRLLIIGLMLLVGFSLIATPVLAADPYEPGSTGWKIKEIIWDAGWIWIIMLVMGLALIFDIIRGIIVDSKGGETEIKKKPSYEIVVRKRIE